MLRAEQQSALNGFPMGQWTSKVESVDPAPSMGGVASNGHVNGANGRALQRPASPKSNLRFLRSPEPEFSIKGSSKRTRDDRDMDDRETNGDYRLHFSRSDITQPTPDRYSTQGHSGSISPVDIRHTFVPERTDQWSPNKRHQYRRDLSGSSNPAHRQGRTDQWMPELASSPRSPSPHQRPPLGPRANSTLSNNQSRFGSKPSKGDRRGSESMDRTRYTSLTWTAPGLKSKQINTNSAQRISAATIESPSLPMEAPKDRIVEPVAAEKVIVNGIRGVPTGPKSERVRLCALEANKGRPFIFISRAFLTPQIATIPHLHNFLRKYIQNRSDIIVADTGFYLYFDSTEEGLSRLDQCYWAKNRQLLFNQYVLEMDCHHDGINNTTPNTSTHTHGQPATTNVPSANQTSEIPKQARSVVGCVTSLPTLPQEHQTATTADPGLEPRKLERATSMTVERPATSAPSVLRHSSPLRVPSRQDRDDSSSSISGFTGSDLSASRAHKCHVCENPPWSDSEPLVQCSSCPRRYHRRCHKGPVPQDLELQHTWQCRRCIRKNVQPKSALSNAYFASISPAPSVGQPEVPPAKRPRLIYTAPNPEFIAAATLSNGVPEKEPELHLDGTTIEPVTLPPPEIPDIEAPVDLAPQVNSDELRISEVDDLVERSFTSFVDTKKPEEKAKLILHHKKKNVTRSERDTSIGNDDRIEGDSAPSGDHVESFGSRSQNSVANSKANTPKRHKWMGKGAEKDIIQTGWQSFFSEKSVDEERTATTKGGNRGEQLPSSAPGLRVEISDSPEDSCSVNNVNGSINESNSRHVDAQASPKARLKINVSKPSESQAIKALKPQTGPSQRMKPGRISADKCRTCGRTIAFNPAGPRMCSGCKKEAATAESNVPSAGEASTEKHIEEPDEPPAGLTAAEKIEQNIGALLNSSGPEEEEEDEAEDEADDTEGSQSKSLRDVADEEAALEFSKSKRPCDSCRSRHKRCFHRTDEAVIERSQQDVAEEGIARDDLDFWNASPETDDAGNLGNSTFDDREAPVNHVSNATTANRDRSSSLSPAPDDVPYLPTKTKKRVSHARPATSEFDLGDSRERPPNTYKKLIGMALCSAPDNRMKASEIVHWIADNIPGYGLGEGTKWEGGISATLSMNREKDGNIGLWRKIELDGAKKNDPCWYQLQPGQEYEMLHWDPVLKQPVSPMKHRDEKGSYKIRDRPVKNFSTHNHSSEQTRADGSGSPNQARKPRLKLNAGKTPSIPRKHAPTSVDDAGKTSQPKYQNTTLSNMDIDELQTPDPVESRKADSSDEEPIATSRKKRPMVLKHVAQATVPDGERNNDARSRDALHRVTESSESNVSRTPAKLSITRQFTLPSHSATIDRKIVAQLIKEDTENVDYSAQSLFEEWPELDPANEFDREAKINEIRRRPTRKQKFGIRSHEMYAAPQTSYQDINGYAPPNSNRSMRVIDDDVFAWQKNDDVKHFDSLEEMFDLPLPRSSILQEGQIAYRDGPKTEFDGTRRRAKKILPTGYAKHH